MGFCAALVVLAGKDGTPFSPPEAAGDFLKSAAARVSPRALRAGSVGAPGGRGGGRRRENGGALRPGGPSENLRAASLGPPNSPKTGLFSLFCLLGGLS